MKKIFSMMAASAAAIAVLASCNNGNQSGIDDGKIDPSTIASDALVAYIPFDGSAVEALSKTEASEKGSAVSYVNGRRGKCLQGAENGYLIFNLPQLNKMSSFSISMWINQPTVPSSQAPVPCYISFLNSENFWNDLAIVTDRRDDDFIAYKLYWKSETYDVWKTSDGKTDDAYDWGMAYPANRWTHIIWSYDENTSEFHAFVNGVDVTPENYVAVLANDAPAGAITFHPFTQVLINGWSQKVLEGATDEWMGWMNGQMDELRIYNKGLNATEAKNLYDAEISQL